MNIKNILVGALIVLTIVLISGYIPMLSMIIIGIPGILVWLSKKGNIKEVSIVILILAIFVYFSFGLLNMLFIIMFVVLNLTVLIYSDKNKISAVITQVLLTTSILISFSAIMYILNIYEGISIIEIFSNSLRESKEILKTSDVLSSGEFNLDEMISQILIIVPFIMILISTVNAMIMYFFNRFLLIQMNYEVVKIKKFSNFKLPMHFVYGITFILLLSYIVGIMNIVNFNSISLNVILMMIYIFAFQGMAILFYFLESRNVNKIVKIVIFLLIMIFKGIFILSALGWVDMIFDFRKIKKSE